MVTLGIDLGTSGVKIALVGDGDRVIGHSSQPLTVSRPHTGRSEQSPEDWWTATCHGLDDELVAAHDLAALAKQDRPRAAAALRPAGTPGSSGQHLFLKHTGTTHSRSSKPASLAFGREASRRCRPATVS
jgi:hypothetical protein